jgi:cyclic pyranopterin monophosphate synthase
MKIKNEIKMTDITSKQDTKREAIAQAEVILKRQTLEMLKERKIPKGDVFTTAKIAGIMAAKKTAELIPLCHPLQISAVDIDFEFVGKKGVLVRSRVCCAGRTGVEMEALIAVSVAALTIYDMCKPVDRDIVLSDIKLLKKKGGKSGTYVRKILNPR